MKKLSFPKLTEKDFPCRIAITMAGPEEAIFGFIETVSKIRGVTIEKIEQHAVEDDVRNRAPRGS